MNAICTHCATIHVDVEHNPEDGPIIESTRCNHPGCEVRLCEAGCVDLSFCCDGCNLRFCVEHKILLDGYPNCLSCAVEAVESQEPDCHCTQTDVDMFDPRGCPFHDRNSDWNVRLRAVTAMQEYEREVA